MTDWISADKQLPEDDTKKYLVYFPRDVEMWVCRSLVYGREGEPKKGTWFIPDGRGGYYEGDHDDSDCSMSGTYWMNLPDRPVTETWI